MVAEEPSGIIYTVSKQFSEQLHYRDFRCRPPSIDLHLIIINLK